MDLPFFSSFSFGYSHITCIRENIFVRSSYFFCTALSLLIKCNARLLTCAVKFMKRAESLASELHLHRCLSSRIYIFLKKIVLKKINICVLWQLSTQEWINAWSKIDDKYSRIEIPETTFDTAFWLTARAIYLDRINLVKYFSINRQQVNTEYSHYILIMNINSYS